MNLMLLAAGEGTRFRPHTLKLPKPCLPFCGLPLLFFPLYLAKKINFKRVVINTFHLPDEIHKLESNLNRFNAEFFFSDEKDKLLGSAGGIARARPWLEVDDDFIVMNGDEVILPKNQQIMEVFYSQSRANGFLANLMVMKHPEAGKKFGAIWVSKIDGMVKGFGKLMPPGFKDLEPFHFIGPMYFRREIFNYLSEEPSNILYDSLSLALTRGEKVGICCVECDWYETGNLIDFLSANRQVLELVHNRHPFLMEMFLELNSDYELNIHNESYLLKHKSSILSQNTSIKGFAVLGEDTVIEEGVYLENVICNSGITLKSDGNKFYINELFL